MMQRVFVCAVLLVAVTAQCANQCNGQCFDASGYTCAQDQTTNQQVLCPIGYQSCNGACFSPSNYHCLNGGLAYGAASQTPSPTTQQVTPTTQTSNGAPTSTIPGTNDAAWCPSWLTKCGAACYNPTEYCCQNGWLTYGACSSQAYCPNGLSQCDAACYRPSDYCCSNGILTKGTCAAPSTTKSVSTTVPVVVNPSPAAPTTAPVIVSPTPSPSSNFPTQTADLRIINNCKSTLWIEGRYGNAGGPIPGQSNTATRTLPGSYVDYVIPDTGLGGTRFWAKYGCDSNGRNCEIGDQMQYWPNPPGGCPTNGCTPPVDSLFEATWGCRPGTSCNNANPTTWFDTSQVDGWTIPYKLTPLGDTSKCDCLGSNCGFKGVDASTLDLARCPSGEDLTGWGNWSSVNANGKSVSLRSIDLRIIDAQNRVVGCMSPCKKLNWSPPYGLGQSENQGSAMWMCCPTPNPSNCSPANGCILPNVCRAGPIEGTQFVKAVHDMAPGVYAYSYDDGVGLHACPAGVVKYTMEFCPSGSAQYPLQL